MGVALMLIVVLCWLFYRYSGAQWGRLKDFFFNWETLEAIGGYSGRAWK
jgi:hypothetical protein